MEDGLLYDYMSNLIRIISKIEIKGPNLVKGISFEGQRVLGDPQSFIDYHSENGADEIFIQDTVASLYDRSLEYDFLKKITENINIPVTVAGGIRSIEDIKKALRSGADKVALNSHAIKNINFLKEAVRVFGSQCIVSSIEAKKHIDNEYLLYYEYGRENSNIRLSDWIKEICEIGVGEIMLTSVDNDGTAKGLDLCLGNQVNSLCTMPLILSGGFNDIDQMITAIEKYDLRNFSLSRSINYHLLNDRSFNLHSLKGYEQILRKHSNFDFGNKEFIKNIITKKEDIDFQTYNLKSIKETLLKSKIPIRL